MRYRILLVTALLSSGIPGAGAAQVTPPRDTPPAGEAPAGEIRGVVVSAEAGEPMRGASVVVRGEADSAVVAGAATSADGSFRIEGLRPGRYTVGVAALGFQPVDATGVAIAAGTPRVELGEIRLAPAVVALEGITVTGERRQVTLAADRNSYRVEEMPVTSGGTAVDVLRNVLSVEVDAENRVSLRGDRNVAVQINGRTSPLRGEQMGQFLAQLPADAVDRVEVIANPSARYDPEGTAGIVNVVLEEDVEPGFSGGLTVGGGSTGRLNASGNLGYQAGPLTLFGSYGFMRDERESSAFSNTEYFGSATFAEQEIRGTEEPRSHNLTANGSLRLSRQGELSANLVVSQRGADRTNLNVLRELDGGRVLTGTSRSRMNGESDNLTLDYALSYEHAFRPGTSEITTELRFNRETQDRLQRFTPQPLAAQGSGGSRVPMETDATDELHTQWTLQSDWTRMLGERTRLETGYKGTLRRMDDELAVSRFSPDRNAYLPDDPARSSRFEYDETVHAVYGVLSRNLDRFEVRAGLRLERAATRFGLAPTGAAFDDHVGSFFPSALVAFTPDDARQVKLSYSKRIQRPTTAMLNPVGFALDPLNVSRGNPELQPEYTHAFELGYQQSFDRGSLQLTPFYRRTVDAVRLLRTVDDDGVTTHSYANVATRDSYGTELNGSVRLGRITGFGGISAFQQVTDATNLGADLSNRGFEWSARANATLRISRTLDAQGFLMYSAPTNAEQGRVAGTIMTDLAIRQTLLDDRASVSLRIVDPFDTTAFRWEVNGPHFSQETERRFASRGVFLTFGYHFGGPSPERQRPGDGHGG